MRSKHQPLLVLLLLSCISACTSQYRGRMVRVKTPITTQVERQAKVKTQHENPGLRENNQALIEVTANLETEEVIGLNTDDDAVPESEHASPFYTIPLRIAQKRLAPRDSVLSTAEKEDIDYRKGKYRQANKYALWALGSLLSTFLTSVFGLIGAIILSAMAVHIYFRYKNPGVTERYGLALAVLIFSIVLLLLLIGLIMLLIFF